MTTVQVRAAGGVIVSQGKPGDPSSTGLRVAVVHRPDQDDWSFPKGKLDAGETIEECALREVLEETGYVCELGQPLAAVEYIDGKGRPKVVNYWIMNALSGGFEPNSETDEIRWLRPKKARRLLSYEVDWTLLDEVVASVQ